MSQGNFILSFPELIPIFAHVELHKVVKCVDQSNSAYILLDGITKEQGADPAGGGGFLLDEELLKV